MTPVSWQDWIAWGGIVLPLAVLAWSAWRYVSDKHEEKKFRRFNQFFDVTDKIGKEGGSIMSKVAAVYELRRFPEYAEVIKRMTEKPDIRGDGRPKEILEEEFRLTNQFMKEKQ